MSCDVAASALLFLAAASSGPAHPAQPRLLLAVAAPLPAPGRLASEPLYADIIGRARALKAQVEAWRRAAPAAPLPGYDAFKTQLAALSGLDMKGHLDLAARGTDGDLKCILKGISQDLPKKLADLDAAPPAAREGALRELGYLLNDNVEVLTAPAAKPV